MSATDGKGISAGLAWPCFLYAVGDCSEYGMGMGSKEATAFNTE
jgi:hypothetical protein